MFAFAPETGRRAVFEEADRRVAGEYRVIWENMAEVAESTMDLRT